MLDKEQDTHLYNINIITKSHKQCTAYFKLLDLLSESVFTDGVPIGGSV